MYNKGEVSHLTIPSQRELPSKPLNPHLLATPYQVQTNWHVISGAPSCGKTTLIELLAAQGYPVVAETGRQYIEREIAKGRPLAEIYDSEEDERAMMDLQLRTERLLRPAESIFLDRALPDVIAFYRLQEMDPNEVLRDCFHYRYASVFILDCLPLELDGARPDDDSLVDYLDRWHAHDYEALGYEVIRVPVLPPQERLSFILETLARRDLI